MDRVSFAERVWYESPVPVFIEKVLLPLGAVTLGYVIWTNPMQFDVRHRVALGLPVLALLYFLSRALHLRNEKIRVGAKETVAKPINSTIPLPDVISPSQVMRDSPGGIQVGRDMNIALNTERKLTDSAVAMMIDGLRVNKCPITVGVLGTGGETEQLASQIYMTVRKAIPEVGGINHGVGFEPFSGIHLTYSPVNPPLAAVQVISSAFAASKIDYLAEAERRRSPGSIYIFVGFKP